MISSPQSENGGKCNGRKTARRALEAARHRRSTRQSDGSAAHSTTLPIRCSTMASGSSDHDMEAHDYEGLNDGVWER